MPLQKLKFAPTMVANNTEYAAEGSWRTGDKVRFRYGMPETIGGWVPTNNAKFIGTCRALTAWRTLAGERLLGLGTDAKYYLERSSTFNDITPIRRAVMVVNPIKSVVGALAMSISSMSTTMVLQNADEFPPSGTLLIGGEQIFYSSKQGNMLIGLTRGFNTTIAAAHMALASVFSNAVLITDMAHGAIANDFVTLSGAGPVGGIPAIGLNKEFRLLYRDPDSYHVITEFFATSAAVGGGEVDLQYQVNVGAEVFTELLGWGAGTWGSGAWGQDNMGGEGFATQLRIWNHQNFGEDLVYGPRGGRLYYWDATNGVITRGFAFEDLPLSSDVPTVQNKILVTESRFLLVFGTNPIGSDILDPLLIRWSDQELIQVFTPTPTNLAGDLRLAIGSEIVTAVQTRQEILVWTDAALYSLQFSEALGFVQSLIADNISIAGPNSVIVANNNVFWMGKDKFYTYTGRSDTLPCSVSDFVFDNFNIDQRFQVYAGVNESFDEVWWFYPSKGVTQNNRYVAYNYIDNGWIVGSMPRTAWLDVGLLSNPVATFGNRLYSQEMGPNDGTLATPVPLKAFIESGDFALEAGDSYAYVRRILPDMTFSRSQTSTPTALITLQPRPFSGSPYRAEGATPQVVRSASVPVEQYTEQLFVRLRGRQMKLRVESDNLGTAWRLGVVRIEIQPDGGRS